MRINLIKFRKIREKGERSQTYIAKRLGITRQHYSNLENGLTNPSFELMKKFGEVFKDEYEDMWELWKNE